MTAEANYARSRAMARQIADDYERRRRGLRKRGQHVSGKHTARRQLCAEYGVKNTGRQWRKLRKALARWERREP